MKFKVRYIKTQDRFHIIELPNSSYFHEENYHFKDALNDFNKKMKRYTAGGDLEKIDYHLKRYWID